MTKQLKSDNYLQNKKKNIEYHDLDDITKLQILVRPQKNGLHELIQSTCNGADLWTLDPHLWFSELG